MKTWKVLVTGSRDFKDTWVVQKALAAERVNGGRMIVIQGGARGADHIAKTLALQAMNVTPVEVAANWDLDGKGSAGPIRNEAMLALGPDVVLALKQRGAANIGTSHMIKIAEREGVPVKIFWNEEATDASNP